MQKKSNLLRLGLVSITVVAFLILGFGETALAGQAEKHQGPVCAFDANALWIKGDGLDRAGVARTDPTQTTQELKIGYGESFTVHVSYRCPSRDENQWAKVSFRLSVQKPDGLFSRPHEDQKEVLAGEGMIPRDRIGHWAASSGRVTIIFTEDDPAGTYILRVTVIDHVGKRQIVRTTKVHLS